MNLMETHFFADLVEAEGHEDTPGAAARTERRLEQPLQAVHGL
jgi:hypothetical protein